jgi:hypothetical protein
MRLILFHLPLPLLFCLSIIPSLPVRSAAQQATSPTAPTVSSSAPPSTAPVSSGVAGEPKKEPAGTPPSPLIEGIQMFRAREFNAAAAKLTEATRSTAVISPKAYAWLARTDLHLHKVEDAEAAARKATELDPALPVAQSALAEVFSGKRSLPKQRRFCGNLPRQIRLTAAPASSWRGSIGPLPTTKAPKFASIWRTR